MKKNIFALAIAAICTFCFASCDGMEDLDLIGHINLTATNPTGGDQAYADSTSLQFKSAMCNVTIDSVEIVDSVFTGTVDIHAGTVMVGTTQNLISNDIANITYPLCGINVRDTNTGVYEINCPVDDFAFFEHLDTANVSRLITSGLTIGDVLGNIFVVAVNEETFYIGYSGNVTITSYGRNELSRVEGTVNDVNAIYVTVSQIEALSNMPETERAGIDLINYFPHITFNGNFSTSRADINTVLEALNESGK